MYILLDTLGKFEKHCNVSFGNPLSPCTTAAVSGAEIQVGLWKLNSSDKVMKVQVFYVLLPILDNVYHQNNPSVSPIYKNNSNCKKNIKK